MTKTLGLNKYHFITLLREPITMFLAIAMPFIMLFLQQNAMGVCSINSKTDTFDLCRAGRLVRHDFQQR